MSVIEDNFITCGINDRGNANRNLRNDRQFSKSISIDHKNSCDGNIRNCKVGQVEFLPLMIAKSRHDTANSNCTNGDADAIMSIANADYRKNTFQSIYYQQEELPEVASLPYGLVDCDNGTSDEITSKKVLDDALGYINGTKKTWVHDFTVLTNIQIAINEDNAALLDWDFIFPVIQFVSEHIKNIRSTVAKNAILTAHVIGIKAHDSTSKIKIQLLPSLFSASICEKIVIRKPANDALDDFSRSCRNWSDSPYLWALCLFSRDRNARICAVAARLINLFIKSIDKHQLSKVEINQLNQYLNLGLGGKLADTRRHFVDTVEYLLDNKNDSEIKKWLFTLSMGTPLYSLVSLREVKSTTSYGTTSDCEVTGGINGLKRRPLSNFLNKTRVNVKPMEHSLDGTPSVS